MKKYLAVAVIFLFIGLAVAPSINANVSKEEMVEFTTEICGLNGGKQSVKLTQQQANEVEALFDSIREQLNATESREEAEEIFKEAVVELDKYGLLCGLSEKQAQRLVTGGYQTPVVKRILDRMYNRNSMALDEIVDNLFCLITGRTDITYFLGMISPLVRVLRPTAVMNKILFGTIIEDWLGSIYYYPSSGWVFTLGLKGIRSWNGSFWGNLYTYTLFPFYIDVLWTLLMIILFMLDQLGSPSGGSRYSGVMGFSGIKILFDDASYFYLGFALRVGITYETPEYP